MIKGQVISGQFGEIIIRQKSDAEIELGELLVVDTPESKIILQVFDLMYGSQISQLNRELISGMELEEDTNIEFLDPQLRNYLLAKLKNLVAVSKSRARISKTLPGFFSHVRELEKSDLDFLTKPKNELFLGSLRSGSKDIDFPVFADGKKVFSHHVLIPATTGRGKSNLTSVILWNTLEKDYCGTLVLDPHDEYYGRNSPGLKDHPQSRNKVIYYTPKDPPVGCRTLKINLRKITPAHFNGVVDWSPAQHEALNVYFKQYGNEWIESIIIEKPVQGFNEATLAVIKRRLLNILDLQLTNNQIFCKGIFDLQSGATTLDDIAKELEEAKTVIIDTSNFSGQVEILIGSLITTSIFRKYKNYKIKGELRDKPVISVILEEAPRVLGKEVLEKGPNIFSTIAREGRKFKVGLIAITQLPSLIPREILANMNTKIILGIEMASERQAVIESASQDLSEDNRTIASLDIGEAIVTSNFVRFAIPIKIPDFREVVKNKDKTQETLKKDFSGIGGI
ncbi:MAG: ATP-binding protein [Candidatus Woesearchaeota archaeon]